MNPRKKDGIISIISGGIMVLSGIVAIGFPVDPNWLPIVISIISAITAAIFGAKAVIK